MSLRQRLLILVLGTVATIWVAATAVTYRHAHHELNELLDAHLTQASTLLIAHVSEELDDIEAEHAPLLHKYSSNIAFQIWEEGEELLLHSANAPNLPMGRHKQGFTNTTIDNQQWRVFSIWDPSGELLIHVAELANLREHLAQEITGKLMLPLLLALPLLAVLLWWMVSTSLRPLLKLTRAVEQRNPDNLMEIDLAAPSEVSPLITTLNRLFRRTARLIENERRFTADAAHELRTPIAAIKSQVQVAQNATDSSQRQHALQKAVEGCNRATHLTAQLLTLARLESVDQNTFEPCNLGKLAVGSIAERAANAIDAGIEFELSHENDAEVLGNPTLLDILLGNLLDNAIRHTRPGTRIRVSTLKRDEHACLIITDNGPGLPTEEMNKITARFYRPTNSSKGGSGLGLSIVKQIVDIHHGTLNFEPADAASGTGLTVTACFEQKQKRD